jgi:flavin reductase (DIM6/NTAB) family NADH-FMN oxidoreductase RutF
MASSQRRDDGGDGDGDALPTGVTMTDDGDGGPATSAAATGNGGWTTYDADDDLTASARYGLCISAVVPRPVAVITTVNDVGEGGDGDQGRVNCAPYSYTGLLSHDPAIISHGLVLSGAGRKKKDTLRNIEATGKWVAHVLSAHYLAQANTSAESLPYGVDETVLAGLPLLHDTANGVPRLADARVAMECTLWDTKEVFNDGGVHTTTIVLGRVTRFHIHSSVLRYKEDDPKRPLIDLHALQGVGRAGDVTYWPVGTSEGTVVAMDRPT